MFCHPENQRHWNASWKHVIKTWPQFQSQQCVGIRSYHLLRSWLHTSQLTTQDYGDCHLHVRTSSSGRFQLIDSMCNTHLTPWLWGYFQSQNLECGAVGREMFSTEEGYYIHFPMLANGICTEPQSKVKARKLVFVTSIGAKRKFSAKGSALMTCY